MSVRPRVVTKTFEQPEQRRVESPLSAGFYKDQPQKMKSLSCYFDAKQQELAKTRNQEMVHKYRTKSRQNIQDPKKIRIAQSKLMSLQQIRDRIASASARSQKDQNSNFAVCNTNYSNHHRVENPQTSNQQMAAGLLNVPPTVEPSPEGQTIFDHANMDLAVDP